MLLMVLIVLMILGGSVSVVVAKGFAFNTHLKCYPQIAVVFPEALMFLASPQIPRNIFTVCPVAVLWPWAEMVFFIITEGLSKKR